MNKKILVLNIDVSGMNKYLFAQLINHGWELSIYNVPVPKRLRYWALFISFVPIKSLWKKKFDYHLNKLIKSSWCFKWRTKWCEKLLKEKSGQFDLVLNMTGVSAPVLDYVRYPDLKYFIVTSYNMILSRKYEEWCAYTHEFDKWVNLEKQLYKNAEVIFTTNENARISLIRDYSIEEQQVVNIGYGLTLDVLPNLEKKYDGRNILFVGFDFKRKGGFALLDAFKKVRNTIPDAKLTIIGPNKSIYQIKGEGVEFLGPIKDKLKVQEYYKKASLFVIPSLCEPFGLVLLEAMSYKLPCIGSNIDAMSEIIDDGISGYLIDPTNVSILADKILELLQNRDKLQSMGNAAYNKVKNSFTWEQVGNNINFHLEKILRNDN